MAVVLVALVAAGPALGEPGLLNTRGGGDSPFLLQRLHQLTAALADGHFPARWMPDAAYGDGYPFYNFYAPLSIYVAAVFRLLGFSFVRAIHLAQLAGFVVAGLGAFYLARRWLGSPWAGLLAAVAYTVAPFHMVNVYVRGDSLAEFWAMAWYPWVLLAADRLVVTSDQRRVTSDEGSLLVTRHSSLVTSIALFALAYAALILSHNISALIFSPFLLLYLLFGFWRDRRATRKTSFAPLLRSAAALLLAFALAAWFFVPALAEQGVAQLGPVTEGYFHYSNHFRGLTLVQGGLLFDYNPDGGIAFRMGLVQAALAVVGGWALVAGRRRPATNAQRPLLFILASFLLATFMITPLSRPLWDHLPLLPFTQFPWRFLSVQALFGALLTGALVSGAGGQRSGGAKEIGSPLLLRSRAPLLTVGASLVLIAAALLGLTTDHLILTDADVTAERLAQYEWFTGNVGTTISAEYLTPAAAPRPWTSAWLNSGTRDRAVAVAGELSAATLRTRTTTRQTWDVAAGPGGATVVFPTLMWPGWRAEIDGQPVQLAAQPGSGLMTLTTPEGEHAVTLTLGRTPIRVVAEAVSVVALVVTTLLFLVGVLPTRHSPPAPHPSASSDADAALLTDHWPLLTLCLLLLAALAFAWGDDPRELPPGDLTWDFAQMAYLHHDRDGVAFEDGARLYEYGYSADEVIAGQTLTVTLSVAPGDGRAATLALVTPASARPTADGSATPPVVVAATVPLSAATALFVLPIPPDAPPGLYVPRLTLDGARPLLPSGGTRGDLFLRPVRVESGIRNYELGMESREAEDAGRQPALQVETLGLALRDATTLEGRFAWYTARPLGARYQFSWRLQDAAGGTLAQLDAQPGYGFQPSTLWPAGQWTADWLALRLPDAAVEGDYPLVMRLYDPTSGQTLLTRRAGVMTWADGRWTARLHEPVLALPTDLSPTTATFGRDDGPRIALPGYRLARDDDALRLTLVWQAAGAPGDFTRFVHLLDAGGNIVAQFDGAPAGDSYPTGQWQPGEVVADALTFDLSALPPGEYRVAVGFYAPTEGLPRLPATDGSGLLPDGRFILPVKVVVE